MIFIDLHIYLLVGKDTYWHVQLGTKLSTLQPNQTQEQKSNQVEVSDQTKHRFVRFRQATILLKWLFMVFTHFNSVEIY